MGGDEAAAVSITVDAHGCAESAATGTEAEEKDFAVGEEEDDGCDEPYC